jgi:hypothetical protein
MQVHLPTFLPRALWSSLAALTSIGDMVPDIPATDDRCRHELLSALCIRDVYTEPTSGMTKLLYCDAISPSGPLLAEH